MDPISLLAILVLAGAIIVLLYYYLENSENANINQFKNHVYEFGETSGSDGSTTVTIDGEEYDKRSTRERVSGMGDKIKGRVNDVSINTDAFSSKIDAFLDEKSDELIKDWSLATTTDIKKLEKKMDVTTRNIGELEQRFNEYRGFTNKKLNSLDERLKKIEK